MDLNFWGECADCGADIELSIKSMNNTKDRIFVNVPVCENCKKVAQKESYEEGFAEAKTKYEQE